MRLVVVAASSGSVAWMWQQRHRAPAALFIRCKPLSMRMRKRFRKRAPLRRIAPCGALSRICAALLRRTHISDSKKHHRATKQTGSVWWRQLSAGKRGAPGKISMAKKTADGVAKQTLLAVSDDGTPKQQ